MLVYGKSKRSDRAIHIRNADNGLLCDCLCPSCNEPLIACQGSIKDWHFKHVGNGECLGSVESSLHLRAKEILSESSYICLPYLAGFFQAISFDPDITEDREETVVEHGQKVALDSRKDVEILVGDFRPDIIVYVDGKPLAIEVAVTHFVDWEKRTKIAKSNTACIEIDLSEFKNKELSDDALIRLLLEDPMRSSWVFNPKLRAAELRCKDHAEGMLNAILQPIK